MLHILDDKGLVRKEKIDCRNRHFFTLPAAEAAFYRAEVFDETRGLRIAIGNPIWNRK